jgi:hypothetical protein
VHLINALDEDACRLAARLVALFYEENRDDAVRNARAGAHDAEKHRAAAMQASRPVK